MRLSLNWLKEFVEIKISPEKLAEKLNLAGFEVEKIEKIGENIKNIAIGEILSIEKHPNADKLQIVKVKTKHGIKEVVCGAPNIKAGQIVPIALIGATLSNGMIIKETKIREVTSCGMLCAEDELGIGSDHSGIYILNPGVNPAHNLPNFIHKSGNTAREIFESSSIYTESKLSKTGEVMCGVKITDDAKKVLGLDDIIFEISVTPNRGDCLSILGLAREMAAITNGKLTPRLEKILLIDKKFRDKTEKIQIENKKYAKSGIDELKVEVKDRDLCPKYMAAVIKDIKIKESPEWIKARLRNGGIRPINNVVDATNYVLLELGQPLHAFDREKIGGKNTKIIIRRAKDKEKIITIDDKERELNKEMLVIANSEKPIAIAGVMGGKESEISENTKDIILESAQFNPASVRNTSRLLGLRSESSVRFEREVDWNITEIALERVIELITELAQGEDVKPIIRIVKNPTYPRKKIKIKSGFINNLLGVEIEEEKIRKIFVALGLKVNEYNNFIEDAIPETQKQLIKEARKIIGRPHKFGAKESEAPKYFDCSSFVQYVYKKVGIIIPRCSIDQVEIGKEIKKADLQAGDLIFTRHEKEGFHYSFNFLQGLDDVILYIGKGKIIHTSRDDKKVREENLKDFLNRSEWVAAKRIIGIKDDYLIVTIPSWRRDLKIKEDLVEEVGRIYDYNKMTPSNFKAELKPISLKKELVLENTIKDIFIALGFDEVYNYSFYGEGKGIDAEKHYKVVNPLNSDQEFLRMTLRPKIAENLEKNINFFDQVKVFEIGNVFLKSNGLPEERKKIIAAVAFKEAINSREKIFKYLKSVFEVLAEKINIEINFLNYKKEGKKIQIKIDNDILGDFEIEKDKGNFELDLATLTKHSRESKNYKKISSYPRVMRDLAIVLDKNIAYKKISEVIKKSSALIQSLELFDVFESEKIGQDKKSLAYHLVFQSDQKTLKSEEADAEIKLILTNLEKDLGAQLRR